MYIFDLDLKYLCILTHFIWSWQTFQKQQTCLYFYSLSATTGFRYFSASRFLLCSRLGRGRAPATGQGKNQWVCVASVSPRNTRRRGDRTRGLYFQMDVIKWLHAPKQLQSPEPDETSWVGWYFSMRKGICKRTSTHHADQRQYAVCH